MKRIHTPLASLVFAGVVAAPMSAFANSGDDPHGLIDYKMGIAQMESTSPASQTDLVIDDQYGIADAKTGAIPPYETSSNHDSRPVSNLLADEAGIALNKTRAQAKGAVVTADGGAVGMIERVVPGETADTVYVRVSQDVKNRTVSTFKINVPKGALNNGQLHLQMTMAELLEDLDAQG
ncbi:hypothetical protein [Rhodobacter sp. TJ_12]|uniref:hypothetical protein n=1 Tax=Rhodobacter sp. TJ_12 TaxID=2029399 RepID=UPI001CC111C7|nr:hypothetical protein [Rhodobacter sp. TJ_12]